MFEVIRYILNTGQDIKLYFEPEILFSELRDLKFSGVDIMNSLLWFRELVHIKNNSNNYTNFRFFDEYETILLSKNIINKLIILQSNGVINPIQRELIMNKIINLRINNIYIESSIFESVIDQIVVHIQKYEVIFLQNYLNALPINYECNFFKH
jgi:uncharacterized protein Smg (DUF494 family)